jgi:hypothetical protein
VAQSDSKNTAVVRFLFSDAILKIRLPTAKPILRPWVHLSTLRPRAEGYGPRPVSAGSFGFSFFSFFVIPNGFLFSWFIGGFFCFLFSKKFRI